MADLSVTAGSVAFTSGEVGHANAGETITAGQVLYLTTAGVAMKSQADGTTLEATIAGVALNGGATGQPIAYAKHGSVINPGATMALGDVYCSSVTAGGIGLMEELASTNKISRLGWPLTTTSLKIDIANTGTVHGA